MLDHCTHVSYYSHSYECCIKWSVKDRQLTVMGLESHKNYRSFQHKAEENKLWKQLNTQTFHFQYGCDASCSVCRNSALHFFKINLIMNLIEMHCCWLFILTIARLNQFKSLEVYLAQCFNYFFIIFT